MRSGFLRSNERLEKTFKSKFVVEPAKRYYSRNWIMEAGNIVIKSHTSCVGMKYSQKEGFDNFRHQSDCL